MKYAELYDFKERNYSEVQIPDGCKTFSIDMDEEVICPNCHETLRYGDGYTSPAGTERAAWVTRSAQNATRRNGSSSSSRAFETKDPTDRRTHEKH